MRRYKFRALVDFGPAAGEGGAPGSGRLTVRACCLLQPFFHRGYFPAVLSRDEELPPLRPGGRAVVTTALTDGEAEAYFAPGQRFTIWADGVVDHTVRAVGRIGYGVISGPQSPPLALDDADQRADSRRVRTGRASQAP